jgi:hypothetical protein
MDSIDVAQDRDKWIVFVNTIMSLRVSYDVRKFLSNFTTGGLSRRAQLHAVSNEATSLIAEG